MILTCPSCGQRNRVPAEKLDAQPKCGACKAAMQVAQPVNVRSAEEFDELLVKEYATGYSNEGITDGDALFFERYQNHLKLVTNLADFKLCLDNPQDVKGCQKALLRGTGTSATFRAVFEHRIHHLMDVRVDEIVHNAAEGTGFSNLMP